MEYIEKFTCIRFKDVSHVEEYPGKLEIVLTEEKKCSSKIGFKKESEMILHKRYCFRKHGIILHELLHALGTPHEHQRYDRINYLVIEWGNIRPSRFYEFYKIREELSAIITAGLPYDFTSIMHYSLYALAKDKNYKTLIPKMNLSEEI